MTFPLTPVPPRRTILAGWGVRVGRASVRELTPIAHWFRDTWALPWRLKGPFMGAIVILLATSVTVVVTDDRASMQAALTDVGPAATWDPLEAEIQFSCFEPLTECATEIMEQHGAPAQAIAFYRMTGWILVSFQEMGTVDLGRVFTPFRANSLGDFALLNGTPSVLVVEELSKSLGTAIQRDPAYEALVRAFPDLGMWSYDEVFEGFSESRDETQRFVFQLTLNDGCHACGTGYHARMAFEFAPDGTYIGTSPLGVCNVGYSDVTPVAASVPPCPVWAATAPSEESWRRP